MDNGATVVGGAAIIALGVAVCVIAFPATPEADLGGPVLTSFGPPTSRSPQPDTPDGADTALPPSAASDAASTPAPPADAAQTAAPEPAVQPAVAPAPKPAPAQEPAPAPEPAPAQEAPPQHQVSLVGWTREAGDGYGWHASGRDGAGGAGGSGWRDGSRDAGAGSWSGSRDGQDGRASGQGRGDGCRP